LKGDTCRVCGFVYKDGANYNTIMAHIKDKHMADEPVPDVAYCDIDPIAMDDSQDSAY